MISQKDIIKLNKPVKAGLHIGYSAPYSGYEDIVLEVGTVLRVSPYSEIHSDEFTLKCLDENISAFQAKYFLKSEQNDEYYSGFNVIISREDLENKFEIIEKADLTKLDFSKGSDRYILVWQIWESHKKIDLLPQELQIRFRAIFKQYKDCLITSNEVVNMYIYAMEQYYKEA